MKKVFCCFLIFVLSFSCKNKCEESNLIDASISFRLMDSSGNLLIGDYWRKYETKDVEFVTETGEKPHSLNISSYGAIFFEVLTSNSQNKDTIVNNFYLKLPLNDGSMNKDIDTIKTTMILNHLVECDRVELKWFEISYNDSLYYSSTIFPNPLNFIKK